MKSYLTHLECSACATLCRADELHTVCPVCGQVLYARYDLDAVGRSLTPAALAGRRTDLWRWRELLPVRDEAHIVTLGEGGTPLLKMRTLGRDLGFDALYVKEEGLNPTGSFKARGMAVAVSRARELGVTRVATPSAGNAAGALAAYGAAAGMETFVFMPDDAPAINQVESAVTGAHVYLVRGLIGDAGRIVKTLGSHNTWFDVSTLKEPYRAEGKKTMGFELAEQLDWQLPTAILYPAGGGTGLIGMWKAFDELERLGWIGPARPRMIAVQAAGCAPIVRAFEQGREAAEPWLGAKTVADGLRVPSPFAGALILRILRASRGTAVAVDDAEILAAMGELARAEGLYAAPEGAATFAAFKRLAVRGYLKPDETVVLFNTGAGLKYPQLVKQTFPVLDPDDPQLAERFAQLEAMRERGQA